MVECASDMERLALPAITPDARIGPEGEEFATDTEQFVKHADSLDVTTSRNAQAWL